MREFHNKCKDGLEDEFVPIRQVAPGPDTEIFELQRDELQSTLRSKAAKRGKSENQKNVQDFDPNDVKEWGDKVTQKEIDQKAHGLITGDELAKKKKMYIGKRETDEIFHADAT